MMNKRNVAAALAVATKPSAFCAVRENKATRQELTKMSPKKPQVRTKWEVFQDESFYSMWAVRPIGDHDFNSPRLFHLPDEGAAKEFKALLDKSYHAVRG